MAVECRSTVYRAKCGTTLEQWRVWQLVAVPTVQPVEVLESMRRTVMCRRISLAGKPVVAKLVPAASWPSISSGVFVVTVVSERCRFTLPTLVATQRALVVPQSASQNIIYTSDFLNI